MGYFLVLKPGFLAAHLLPSSPLPTTTSWELGIAALWLTGGLRITCEPPKSEHSHSGACCPGEAGGSVQEPFGCIHHTLPAELCRVITLVRQPRLPSVQDLLQTG